MGVLDDAIREHLELRRRQGVTDEELQRQEEEALGPARRDVSPAEAEDEEQISDEGEAVEEDPVRAPEAVTDDALSPYDDAEPPDAREPDIHEPEQPGQLSVDDPEPVLDEEPLEDEPPAPASNLSTDTEPHEFEELDDDELLDEEGEPEEEPDEDEDVLEDTPDFLQETPEHDRLWFEQKPPRDFDFD